MFNSITKVIHSLCIFCCFMVMSCSNSHTSQQQDGQPSIPFQTIEKGSVPYSQLTSGIYALHTSSDWSNFWNTLKVAYVPQPSAPFVNFKDNTIIAVVDVLRATGGYSVTITSVQTTTAGDMVQAVHQSPGQSCAVTQAFNQSYHIISVPTFTGVAALTLTESVQDCSP